MKKTVDNELEHLIRTSADEIRLRPSPKVWKGINARLQRRKRNYRAAVLLLLLLGLTVGLYVTNNNNPGNNIPVATVQKTTGNTTLNNQPTENNQPGTTIIATTATAPEQYTQAVPALYGNTKTTVSRTLVTPTPDKNIPANKPTVPVNEIIPAVETPVTGTETEAVIISNNINAIAGSSENNNEENQPGKQASASFTKIKNSDVENTGTDNNSEKIAAENKNTAKTGAQKENKINRQETLPLKDITDAAIQVTTKPRRITTEFYLVPSISYRKLVDSRDPNAAGAISKEDFDKAVYHKPSLGLEAGVSWHYRIYDRFRAKAGLQLNYNRFNMKATRAPQTETARIVLYGNNQVENPSSLRTDNDNGLVQWIKNKNLQISVPVGFEVAVTPPSKSNTTLNIGTTIQPSYLLGNKNYLLSTDLKNYTTEPSLVRRFNMNLGFETFFAFETKKLRWHMGPQLRYQLFSTYTKQYPYKENLIDYTFKISVSKPF